MTPSNLPYSTGWSSTWTASRFSAGSRLGPLGTAQLDGWFVEGGTLGAAACGPLLGVLSAVRLHAPTAATATIRKDRVAFLIRISGLWFAQACLRWRSAAPVLCAPRALFAAALDS